MQLFRGTLLADVPSEQQNSRWLFTHVPMLIVIGCPVHCVSLPQDASSAAAASSSEVKMIRMREA